MITSTPRSAAWTACATRGDLQHHPRADIVGLPHQIAGIAEREGYDPRPSLQRVAKYLRIHLVNDSLLAWMIVPAVTEV
jgi:hypothetical protein